VGRIECGARQCHATLAAFGPSWPPWDGPNAALGNAA